LQDHNFHILNPTIHSVNYNNWVNFLHVLKLDKLYSYAFPQEERGGSNDSNHVATEQAPVAFVGLNLETHQTLEGA